MFIGFHFKAPVKISALPQKTAPIIDEMMESVQATQFDETGRLKQILTVTQWQHQQGAQTAEWQNPHLTMISERGTWSLSARHGTSTQQQLWGHIDEMHLSHHVVVHHAMPNKGNDWLLKTEYLLLLPDKQLAQTSNPVWVEGPWMHMKAHGLTADFRRDTIDFINTVESQYTLPSKRDQKSSKE